MKRINVFDIDNIPDFERIALQIFQFQAKNNLVYKEFLNLLNIDVETIIKVSQIPFLPIQFFKSHKIVSSEKPVERVFLSSGTTGITQSKHFVTAISIYEESFTKGFEHFYGNIEDCTVLALLPSYLERDGSSLIYMANDFIKKSRKPKSGFYLNNLDELTKNLRELDKKGEKVLLIGVSFALLDLVETYSFKLKNTIIMETGGMKGRRKELIREELHKILCKGFGVSEIHSEYGMTELLSQAYSKGNGIFECPPWMKILTRDTEDALTILPEGKSGGINIIDLANINSCSFIATQDLGKTYPNGTFEVLGRFDNSDIRGCNLLILK
ncbi:LuxE/PaaK family acyltransferase [Lutibacter flavus]|uniref:Acyl-protein synthetase, LuxE n=1 Tax=Lutibacter flavus TaxID=691689 RepID=A0A238X3A9_9FLAO|nr:acyl transferase [Lutibacter flavus]SNR53466.1 Acyl-protein synthetase, LuxE [Lutibacter flavus]